jgi:hypothetical protein
VKRVSTRFVGSKPDLVVVHDVIGDQDRLRLCLAGSQRSKSHALSGRKITASPSSTALSTGSVATASRMRVKCRWPSRQDRRSDGGNSFIAA